MIEITLKNYRCFSDEKPARFIIQKGFTAFVGPNNAGKSSLLRFFYEFRGLLQRQGSLTGNLMAGLRGEGDTFSFAGSIVDVEEVFCNSNNRDLEITLRFLQPHSVKSPSGLPLVNRLVVNVPRGTNSWTGTLHADGTSSGSGKTLNIVDGSIVQVDGNNIADLSSVFEIAPSLSKTMYIAAFRNAINAGASDDYFDIGVGESFVRKWKSMQTGGIKRHNEEAINVVEDIKRIFGFHELQIMAAEDERTLQVFVDGKSYKLLELGSGLAQMVIVLANAAMRRPNYILIDEPELNLHPALQLDFLTSLGAYASEGVIFATHSVGLARSAAETVYSVRKDEDGNRVVAEYERTSRLSEFLGELSFSGYREFGFSKLLLVEGSTDVKTIQQFLRKYGKDHQILLLPLGGAQLISADREIELEEILRITDEVAALIDSERDQEGEGISAERQAFVESCQLLGIACKVLDRRSIENYLSETSIQTVKGPGFRALGPYEKLRNVIPGWAKSENWRIARAMNREDLEENDLGEFLKQL